MSVQHQNPFYPPSKIGDFYDTWLPGGDAVQLKGCSFYHGHAWVSTFISILPCSPVARVLQNKVSNTTRCICVFWLKVFHVVSLSRPCQIGSQCIESRALCRRNLVYQSIVFLYHMTNSVILSRYLEYEINIFPIKCEEASVLSEKRVFFWCH